MRVEGLTLTLGLLAKDFLNYRKCTPLIILKFLSNLFLGLHSQAMHFLLVHEQPVNKTLVTIIFITTFGNLEKVMKIMSSKFFFFKKSCNRLSKAESTSKKESRIYPSLSLRRLHRVKVNLHRL